MNDFNTELKKKIDGFYILKSGNNLGWRLLSSPSDSINNAEIALIDQNPGGNDITEHDGFCVPDGQNAYRDETWNSKPEGISVLQAQVLKLFEFLKLVPEEVLTGHIVPFRSPSWDKLKNPKECLEFSRKHIWGKIFEKRKPKLIIALGNHAFDQLKIILEIKENDIEKIPVNWGIYDAKKARFSGGTLIGLPHLSRFTIMTKQESQEPLHKLFKEFLPVMTTA